MSGVSTSLPWSFRCLFRWCFDGTLSGAAAEGEVIVGSNAKQKRSTLVFVCNAHASTLREKLYARTEVTNFEKVRRSQQQHEMIGLGRFPNYELTDIRGSISNVVSIVLFSKAPARYITCSLFNS